jgi:hypothetical protein
MKQVKNWTAYVSALACAACLALTACAAETGAPGTGQAGTGAPNPGAGSETHPASAPAAAAVPSVVSGFGAAPRAGQ